MKRLDRTLEELEGERWPEEEEYPSRLVSECHRLRKVPLAQLTVEDLRLLIGQDIGAAHLVPLALAHLERAPLAEGDLYPGDLLCSVLSLPPAFWQDHADLRARAAAVAARAMDADPIRHVRKACKAFLR